VKQTGEKIHSSGSSLRDNALVLQLSSDKFNSSQLQIWVWRNNSKIWVEFSKNHKIQKHHSRDKLYTIKNPQTLIFFLLKLF